MDTTTVVALALMTVAAGANGVVSGAAGDAKSGVTLAGVIVATAAANLVLMAETTGAVTRTLGLITSFALVIALHRWAAILRRRR